MNLGLRFAGLLAGRSSCLSSISVRREIAGPFFCSCAWLAAHSKARSKRVSVCASVPKWRRLSLTMLAMLNLATLLLRCATAFFRSRNEQAIVELTLRQQLATYALARSKPNITPLDRAFWVALSRFWPRWKDTLVRLIEPKLRAIAIDTMEWPATASGCQPTPSEKPARRVATRPIRL